MPVPYDTAQLDRAAVDAMPGIVALDFGTNWCGYCQAAEPLIEQAIQRFGEARHIKVEDGPGRALGRSFRIKLWPSVVVLKDGQEMARVVRPASADAVREALDRATA